VQHTIADHEDVGSGELRCGDFAIDVEEECVASRSQTKPLNGAVDRNTRLVCAHAATRILGAPDTAVILEQATRFHLHPSSSLESALAKESDRLK
jgi:hypothetical protein